MALSAWVFNSAVATYKQCAVVDSIDDGDSGDIFSARLCAKLWQFCLDLSVLHTLAV